MVFSVFLSFCGVLGLCNLYIFKLCLFIEGIMGFLFVIDWFFLLLVLLWGFVLKLSVYVCKIICKILFNWFFLFIILLYICEKYFILMGLCGYRLCFSCFVLIFFLLGKFVWYVEKIDSLFMCSNKNM